MNFYDIYSIDGSMAALVDPESGEILDYEEFTKLAATRCEKIEGAALHVKNLRARIDDIKAEEKALAARRKVIEGQVETLEGYLGAYLAGEKFESARCKISYFRSAPLEIADEAAFVRQMQETGETWALRYKPPEIDKTAVKQRLAAGWRPADELGVKIVERQNIQIK